MTKTDFLWLALRARLSFHTTAARKSCGKRWETFIRWLRYGRFDEKHEPVHRVVSTPSCGLVGTEREHGPEHGSSAPQAPT